MSKKLVADIIIETLAAAGAKRCYGIAGDTLNYVTDAIRRSDIRWVHVRHEEVGGFAAGAEALLTGELTLCAGSCGPGGLHFINGLFESHRNRAPVVLIASQILSEELGFDFPQEVDFKQVYAKASVFCEEVRTPASARRMAAMAAQAALSKKGVAVLILPLDISKEKVDDEPAFAVHHTAPRTLPSESELADIAKLLNKGGKVAIYGGSGCQDAHDEVIELARRLKAPVAHTSRAKDFLEYSNPYDVGMTGVFGAKGGYDSLMSCDTLLLLGCDFAWKQFYPSEATIIQIDIDGSHLGRRHPVSFAAVGDIKSTLTALLPLIGEKSEKGFLDKMLALNAKVEEKLDERAAIGRSGAIHPQYLTTLIGKHAAPDAIYTADGGSPMVWLLRHIKATGRNRTVISLTHGTMANAMPQALGAKVAFPERQVISLSGDGGLAMLLGDLITAIQENIAIKVVVFNNSSLGFVELEQKVEGLLDSYTGLKNPDFARVAEAIGFTAKRVEKAELLESAVIEWLAAPGPALLDVVTDRMELVLPAKIEPTQVLGMALYSAKAVLSGRGDEVVQLLTENFAD